MQVASSVLSEDINISSEKLGKECIKAVYCHPAYVTYMQSTSCKMLGWMKHKLESRLLADISGLLSCDYGWGVPSHSLN